MSSQGTGTRLSGKVAIVTGAASGFGRAIASRFASEGCRVVVGDINEAGSAETVASIGGESKAAAVRMDVSSEADWTRAVQEAESKFGKSPDIVINNAGWSYRNKNTLEVREEEFDRVFKINVKSIFWSVRAAVPAMQKNGGGSIISVSSIGSERPRPGLVWCTSMLYNPQL